MLGRLTIEIGDAALRMSWSKAPPAMLTRMKTEPFWVEVRDYLTQKCEPYFAAARNGDPELAVLSG